MAAVKFLVVFLFVSLLATSVHAQCQSGTIFNSISELTDNINQCTYSTSNLNQNCVSASCPALSTSSPCPFNNDGTMNSAGVQSALTIINQCMGQLTSVCGTPWDPIPIPPMGLQVDLASVTGTCWLLPNTGFKMGLNSTTATLSSSTDPLTLSLSTPKILISGSIQCNLTVGSNQIQTNAFPFTIMDAPTVTVTIDSSFTPNVTSTNANPQLGVGDVTPNDSNGLTGILTNLGNSLINQSGTSSFGAYANFVSAYVAFALQSVNCQSS